MISNISPGQPLSDNVYQSLFQLQGRSCALVLKELARSGLHRRASELFDWIRALDQGHPLQSLLDVYSYTAAISLCISTHDVDRALGLASEMKAAGIPRNVHTYTALMNVCIKCSKHELALQTYDTMRADRCTPNVVTYNTLIDVHGKMGRWEEAVAVLGAMKAEGIEPVLRTYNTLLIACNMCSQPREAMAVYRMMLDEGFAPNSTTYNALISAYGKVGQLDRVMEVFQEMMYRGCERNVITYSSLISACEKAGRWELALELFQEMVRERCTPNTVTFNSLITALGQGAQWEKAEEVFHEMQSQGCTPDVVTYTALISSLEKGGQWRRALSAFERMRRQGCRADSIVYNAIIDTLWETGVVWAQRQALGLFRAAVGEGHFGQARLTPGMARADVNLHAMTAGVAMLCLYAWLVSLKALVASAGAAAVPIRVAIVTDRGRGAKEQGNLVVKEAVAALMAGWGAPFKAHSELGTTGTLEANGVDVANWLLSDAFEAQLFAYFPCTDILPSVANTGQNPAALASFGAMLDDPGSQKETAVEQRCTEAFSAVRLFEKTHCLALQNMGFAYLQRRSELVARCAGLTAALGTRSEAGHDAVLLMDRVMSTSLALAPELLDLLATACVTIAAKQVDGPTSALALSEGKDIEAITGLPAAAIEQMEWNVKQVLGQDTAAISTLRCLKLYLERLGGHSMDDKAAESLAGCSYSLVDDCLGEMAFLNCRPSVIAAAVLYTDRRARGVIPFWPTMLAKVTGYQDMSTPELSVAIKAAQRMVNKANGGSGLSSSSISTGSGRSSNKANSAGSADSPTNSSSPMKNHHRTTVEVAAEVLKRVNTAGSELCHAPSSVSLASTYQAPQNSGKSLSGSGMGSSEPLNIEGNALTAANQAALLAALEKNGASGGLSHLSAITSSGVLTPVTMSNLTPANVNSSSNTSGGGDSSGDQSNGSDQSSADGGCGNELDVPGATASYLAEAALAD
jgi:pentatricopeptide repeat domain-containing protein 1